jgi:hypothetical protein
MNSAFFWLLMATFVGGIIALVAPMFHSVATGKIRPGNCRSDFQQNKLDFAGFHLALVFIVIACVVAVITWKK